MDLGESLGFPTISIPEDGKDDPMLSPTLSSFSGSMIGADGVPIPEKKKRMRRNTVNIGM